MLHLTMLINMVHTNLQLISTSRMRSVMLTYIPPESRPKTAECIDVLNVCNIQIIGRYAKDNASSKPLQCFSHLLPQNNGQTDQFVCCSRYCKGKNHKNGIIVMLLKATSLQVVNTSQKVN